MSVVIPEYHEHLRDNLYETKRQLQTGKEE